MTQVSTVPTSEAVTVNAETGTLRERAAAAAKTAVERYERERAERAERERESAVGFLVRELKRWLNVEVDTSQVRYETTVRPFATVTVDGLQFGMAQHYTDEDLSVRVACARGCHEALWYRAENLVSLHEALAGRHEHHHDCLVVYDENGEAITDREGRPLSPFSTAQPPAPPTIEMRLADILREIVRDELANQYQGGV